MSERVEASPKKDRARSYKVSNCVEDSSEQSNLTINCSGQASLRYSLTISEMKACTLLSLLSFVSVGQAAFVSTTGQHAGLARDVSQESKMKSSDNLESSRRSMLQDLSLATLGVVSGLTLQKQSAVASGGATAGGAYLLSAKQRYNERVTKGIKNFLALGPSLEADSLDKTQEYFVCSELGCWADLSTAGYLLANAFRRSANTNPDSLPAVKVQ